MSNYSLRSHAAEVDGEPEDDDDYETESDSDAIEDDPFYEPYLENEMLMNVARIVRYETERAQTEVEVYMDDESESSEGPVENTRVVPVSEEEHLPPPPPVVANVVSEALAVEQTDPNLLGPNDFEGIPRYRLSFLCVRYFEFTQIRNIAVASSISNEVLMRALCQIPRGRAVPDCLICSYPLWDSLQTMCCGQSLCIHCVNRCTDCPYCRSGKY